MPLPFYGHTITVLTSATTTDPYGNTSETFDSETEVTVRGHVQPVGSDEQLGARERNQVASDYRVWLDAPSTVTSINRLRWDGLVLVVDGEPLRWSNRFGTKHHVELLASVSTG